MKRFALAAAAVALAALAAVAPLPPAFVERTYANGLFALFNRTFVPLANALPFAAIDAFALVALASFVALAARRGRRLDALTLLALLVLAFELLWGWNYRRAPLATRIDYDRARVSDQRVAALARRIVQILTDDAPAAHAAAGDDAALRVQLARDFAPVAARLGDRWPVALTVPKHTLADRIYQMAGVGGMYVPLTFETLLNAGFLPFEAPRALAHEWAHVAGFGDEGDANLIATIVCLRSPDPLIRYSGAFWTYGELPAAALAGLPVPPQLRADLAAARARFLRYYTPRLFTLSWGVYDRYLRVQGVAGGVTSYSRFVGLLAGTEFDADGLPLPRP